MIYKIRQHVLDAASKAVEGLRAQGATAMDQDGGYRYQVGGNFCAVGQILKDQDGTDKLFGTVGNLKVNEALERKLGILSTPEGWFLREFQKTCHDRIASMKDGTWEPNTDFVADLDLAWKELQERVQVVGFMCDIYGDPVE